MTSSHVSWNKESEMNCINFLTRNRRGCPFHIELPGDDISSKRPLLSMPKTQQSLKGIPVNNMTYLCSNPLRGDSDRLGGQLVSSIASVYHRYLFSLQEPAACYSSVRLNHIRASIKLQARPSFRIIDDNENINELEEDIPSRNQGTTDCRLPRATLLRGRPKIPTSRRS
ncbi:hypothetical protein SCHPADRAFT_287493 [Schizopora paradoxa]|uniref:Uncharacterized protein n=1 Tax=Schizopora paradoxa TaxID=27342 RepID=A0A0H2RT34_9AGAM|nr:hypothetical protein SCHPADRAFT_287493 [Schizopora paradoxa]